MSAREPNLTHIPPDLLRALRRAWGRAWRREAEREAAEVAASAEIPQDGAVSWEGVWP